MSAENRLSADQLAALAPGDVISIESGADSGRPGMPAAVVRRTATHLVIRCATKRGGVYQEQYRLQDGTRDGEGGHAELVNANAAGSVTSQRRRQEQRIDAAYLAWRRDRADVDALRELQDAIAENWR
ncbi:MAG TPA: hypothetical protein VK402_04870 [Blastococcus sp.]|nr:hypothetical protein [Blastococcus sp.]